ncbi:MarR family winged helix-turn-helix transcriptional regulator [Streptomyces sp. PSAA01]|uniref:MarR family winged helix-turn-helix transcriptional regulator n=1 Tax=Streptomyces sp. PSAA01 TaxID=2912762 RepID=UPI001F224807|nr:MarR family winged helix-turn-helix transcriptional regulator [Streptomyces sp. PSAA01]MCG0287319.1 MarR family winged helix-turn-helix transcriptional regulator [Streptomyces sp. PSAA01]
MVTSAGYRRTTADVTPTGYRVLRFVEASSPPGPAVSDIAALLLTDRARAVRVVDRLTVAGLVTRVRDTVDRRVRRVELTDAGRRHIEPAAARRTRLLGEAVADWPEGDLARLTEFLERLNASVARHLPVPGASGASEVADVSDVSDGR